MTKLLYTKQEIIDGVAIIAKLVAEINLRDDRETYGQYISFSGWKDDLTISIYIDFNKPIELNIALTEHGVQDLLLDKKSNLTFEQAIEKLTNFKWSDMDGD